MNITAAVAEFHKVYILFFSEFLVLVMLHIWWNNIFVPETQFYGSWENCKSIILKWRFWTRINHGLHSYVATIVQLYYENGWIKTTYGLCSVYCLAVTCQQYKWLLFLLDSTCKAMIVKRELRNNSMPEYSTIYPTYSTLR